MICKGSKKKESERTIVKSNEKRTLALQVLKPNEQQTEKLCHEVDSHASTNDIFHNNMAELEWAIKNKMCPNFLEKNMSIESILNKEECEFLYKNIGDSDAAIYDYIRCLIKALAMTGIEF